MFLVLSNQKSDYMHKYIGIALFSLLLLSCNGDDTRLQEVRIKNQYSLTIPEFLTRVDDLNEKASLQYMNGSREVYVLVLDDLKEPLHKIIINHGLDDLYSQDLEGFAKLMIEDMESKMSLNLNSDVKTSNINGLDARIFNYRSEYQGKSYYNTLAFVDGKKHYYQIFAWTLASNENKYKSTIDAIPLTFKELD